MPGEAGKAAHERALTEYSLAIVEALRIAKIGVCVTVLVDGVPRNVLVSDAAVEILGHPRDVILSRSAFDFVRPEDRAPLEQSMLDKSAHGGGRDVATETVVVHADGTQVPIEFALTDVVIGGNPAYVSLLWNVSARRAAEAALRAEEARLRRLFESAPDGIVVSRNGEVLEANPAAARMLGLSDAAELVGMSLLSLMSPVDSRAMIERVAAAREGVKLAPRAYEARRRDGTTMTAEITSVPYEHGGKPAVMGFARDVTERLRMQAQLTQSERLAALGTLAAGVAHEINNPLTVMSLGIQAVEARLGRSLDRVAPLEREAISALLGELKSSVDRVAGIVGELRAFARTDEDAPAPTDIRAVLASAEKMAAHRLRHGTTVHSDYGDVPQVLGQARRLEQVFVNLLLNAAQAIDRDDPRNRIDVRTFVSADGRVVVEVRDNGRGMTPEVAARAFDPFFTTKPVGEGTGLGLAISHGIVTRLGGDIALESAVGRGTIVRVHLLRTDATRARSEEPTRVRRAGRSRILIVDDEPALVSSLATLLAAEHDVATAATGEEACRLLLDGAPYDVILCDLMMPGVTGMELRERVERSRPEMLPRIVFMTGGAFTPRAAEFLARTSNRVLEKPFAIEELLQVVAEVHLATA